MKSFLSSSLGPALCLLTVLCFGFASPASAQPEFRLGLRAGVADLSGNGLWRDVPDDTIQPLGLQGELRWPAFSLRVAYEQADVEGTFLPGFGRPASLGPTYDIDGELNFLHLTAAYNGEPSGASWSWFAGGGLTYVDGDLTGTPRGTSPGRGFTADPSSNGIHLVGGLRWALGERWELGGEVTYLQMLERFHVENFGAGLTTDDLDGFGGAATLSFGF